MTDLETRPARPTLSRAAPALLGYAAVRALGLLALALWSAARDKSAYTLLTARWDSLWYVRVAELGYGYEVRLPNGDVHSNLAFFPLLPWLERLGHAVTPLSYADAGFAVGLLASLAAAWGIFAVADLLYGRRAGVCAVLVWAVLPVGIVQSMAYSESLFTALAAWSLYAVITGRWLTAGALTCAAGLNRPTAVALIAALAVAALLALRERRDGPLRPLAALAIAPLGLVGYLGWVGHEMGDYGGYFALQRGAWAHTFDYGEHTLDVLTSLPVGHFDYLSAFPFADLIGTGVVLLALALLPLLIRERPPAVLVVYTVLTLALVLGSQQIFANVSRYLLPAFPLFLPLAAALRRLTLPQLLLLLGPAALASGSYAGYALFELGVP
ncbi:glycosyltransferase family 39 protein [Streptomyces glaucescens]|uniref:glycosyltransferase family 39 protein n=1 Tax=Streptomyces glaucescens TaxID=1907 RepID=UPI000A38EA65|nr:glycosyltransferase family 39 protein [Streptomyces glaucescens]